MLMDGPCTVPDLIIELREPEKPVRRAVELLLRLGHAEVSGKSTFNLYRLTPRGVGYARRWPRGARQ